MDECCELTWTNKQKQTPVIKPVTEHDRWVDKKNGGVHLERPISRKLELGTQSESSDLYGGFSYTVSIFSGEGKF